MAIAALAAQPPPVMTTSWARTLRAAVGKRSTRKMMSCTAIPAQSKSGLIEDTVALLDPTADDVVRDRDRRRRAQPGWMPAKQHRGGVIARQPPRILELGMIHGERLRQCLGVASHHQRHRKRPGLRREITHPSAGNPCFLPRLPPDRLLYGLARLDETCEA